EGDVLVEVAAEQATIARARELRGTGLALRAVASALAAEGRFARNGREFAAQSIKNMADDNASAAA
ncbi:MAG: hypothetical protein ABTD50_24610, partial [Polyangiaceae bacterium]